jgi:hypothetical protein
MILGIPFSAIVLSNKSIFSGIDKESLWSVLITIILWPFEFFVIVFYGIINILYLLTHAIIDFIKMMTNIFN